MDIRNNLSLINQFNAHDNAIKCMAINPDNNTLISGSCKGEIKVWDLNGISNAELSAEGLIRTAAVSQDIIQASSVISMKVRTGLLYSSWADGTLRVSSL